MVLLAVWLLAEQMLAGNRLRSTCIEKSNTICNS
jgi:hypothetical protein